MIFRKSSEKIDIKQFEKIWDTYANVMNSEGEADELLEFRHTSAWDALDEIGSKYAIIITQRNREIANLKKELKYSMKSEILYAVRIGYLLFLIEEIVSLGEPIKTKDMELDKELFMDKVIDWPNHYIHSPLETSLCEYHSKVAIKDIAEENPHLSEELLSPLKEEILSAALYGCAAGAIEERFISSGH